jgi:energy-coupling factor transport system ATP-binding protein
MHSTKVEQVPQPNPAEIAFIPSNPRLLFSGIKPTVRGEIEFSFQVLGRAISDVSIILARLGIERLADQDPFTLSGGETVRAAIALAAVKQPRVWIVDQIYDALAPDSRLDIYMLLRSFASQDAAILETHSRPPPWIGGYDEIVVFERDGVVRTGNYDTIEENVSSIDLLTPQSQLRKVRKRGVQSADYIALEEHVAKADRVFRFQGMHEGTVPLQAIELQFQYGRNGFRLGPVSVECQPGQVTALVGPNGAGKTTLLKLLAGLMEPSAGMLRVHGRCSPSNARDWARSVLYCFQDPDDQLYLPRVRDELFQTARNIRNRATGADWIIETLGLGGSLDLVSTELPLSQRRLVSIASALIASPPILALDEPTAALDMEQSFRLVLVLMKYLSEGGTIVLVSHDYDFVGELPGRLIVVEAGGIVCEAAQDDWPLRQAPFALQESRGTGVLTTSLRTLLRDAAKQGRLGEGALPEP